LLKKLFKDFVTFINNIIIIERGCVLGFGLKCLASEKLVHMVTTAHAVNHCDYFVFI